MSSPNRYNIFCISDTKKCIFYAQQQKKRKKKDKLPHKKRGTRKEHHFRYAYVYNFFLWICMGTNIDTAIKAKS